MCKAKAHTHDSKHTIRERAALQLKVSVEHVHINAPSAFLVHIRIHIKELINGLVRHCTGNAITLIGYTPNLAIHQCTLATSAPLPSPLPSHK